MDTTFTPLARCPHCVTEDGRFLRGPSADAWVNYFYCDGCGHNWTHDKPGSMYHSPSSTPNAPAGA
jgi:hypothetical protein